MIWLNYSKVGNDFYKKYLNQPFSNLSLFYKTNRFDVDILLFSNKSHNTSKCGKNNNDTRACGSCVIFLFVICDLLLNIRTATWNLLILSNKRRVAIGTYNYCLRSPTELLMVINCGSIGCTQLTF